MKHEEYTLAQARELLKIKEVVDWKQTLLGALVVVPFFLLLLLWVNLTVGIVQELENGTLGAIALITFMFCFVKLFGWVGDIKLFTRYVQVEDLPKMKKK